MPVYLMIEIAITDQEMYAEYVEKVAAVVQRYGGRYLVRGGNVVSLAGDWCPQRIILVEFEAIEQIQKCFTSPEYLDLAPLRERSTTSRAIILEGCQL